MRRVVGIFGLVLTLLPFPTWDEEPTPCSTLDVFGVYLAEEGLREYLRIARYEESRGDSLAVGRGYYRGWYSIGKSAARDARVPYDSLFSTRWSDTAMVRLMRVNWGYLGTCQYFSRTGDTLYTRDYHRFVGSTVNGMRVTPAMMLWGAHTVGHISVKVYLNSSGLVNPEDANGKSVNDCFREMQGVRLYKF